MKTFDTRFLSQLQARDQGAFGIIYDTYVDQFYRYIKGHYTVPEQDIHDIVSDIFVKIRHGLPRIDTAIQPSGWLWTIARNTIKDHFKRNTETPFASFSFPSDGGQENVAREETLKDPDDIMRSFQTQHTFEQIKGAMDTLDETYSLPIYYMYVEELSYAEIAQNLSISQDTARQRISRGLKKLLEKLAHIQ